MMDKILLGAFIAAIIATFTNAVMTDRNLRAMSEMREAVNMIEEAAHQINESAGRIDQDLDVFPLIAAQNRCEYERGEWHYETGQCYLQEEGQ